MGAKHAKINCLKAMDRRSSNFENSHILCTYVHKYFCFFFRVLFAAIFWPIAHGASCMYLIYMTRFVIWTVLNNFVNKVSRKIMTLVMNNLKRESQNRKISTNFIQNSSNIFSKTSLTCFAISLKLPGISLKFYTKSRWSSI